MNTKRVTQAALACAAGGVFNPTVANCKQAFTSGLITTNDLKRFQADRSYRGNTDASKACLGAAAWGQFGLTESQVKKTFGMD